MGTFHVRCRIENPVSRGRAADVANLLVDTGSECTWVPAVLLDGIGIAPEKPGEIFVPADGREIRRAVGFAVIRLGDHFTIDEVVFAEPGDLLLLGARTLEGLNLTVDAARKRLVAGGPRPAAPITR